MNAWQRERIEKNNPSLNQSIEGMADWKSRHAFFIKCVSIVLIFTFLYQNIVEAQGGLPVWSTKVNGKTTAKTVNGYVVPYNLADIKEGLENGGDEVIINIQDAHSNLGAQKSIAGIIDDLVKNYNVKLVALEGSEGFIDTTLLSAFPDKKIKENAANYLMKEGKISAGEFFSIMNEKPVTLYGIENSPLYIANVKAFRKTIEQRIEKL